MFVSGLKWQREQRIVPFFHLLSIQNGSFRKDKPGKKWGIFNFSLNQKLTLAIKSAANTNKDSWDEGSKSEQTS